MPPNQWSGRTFLITGGAGSFGTAVTRQLLLGDVAEVRILSRDPSTQARLVARLDDPRVRCHLGDIRDYRSVLAATRGVDFVLHAAALKGVPECERDPILAAATNVVGSGNVFRAAQECGARSVVALSTDKAVHPVSAMGMTKNLMERAALAMTCNGTGPTVAITRYGNVLCSRGSVVPLFVSQLRAGRALTVTDASMTRFLMSLPEAVSLVLFALANAGPGDVLVRKSPACTIGDLAHAVALLVGAEPVIEVVGARPGERRWEYLLSARELDRAVDRGDYYQVPGEARPAQSQPSTGPQSGGPSADGYHSHNAPSLTVPEVAQMLSALPEMKELLAQP